MLVFFYVNSFFNFREKIITDSTKITDIIAKDLALAMSKAYEPRRRSYKIEMNKQDTKYVYIDRKKLIDYLGLYPNSKGIKVYFGVIDDHKIPSDSGYRCKLEHKH